MRQYILAALLLITVSAAAQKGKIDIWPETKTFTSSITFGTIQIDTPRVYYDTVLCYALITDETDGQGYAGKSSIPFRLRCLNIYVHSDYWNYWKRHIKYIDEQTKEDLPWYYLIWQSVDITPLGHNDSHGHSLQPVDTNYYNNPYFIR